MFNYYAKQVVFMLKTNNFEQLIIYNTQSLNNYFTYLGPLNFLGFNTNYLFREKVFFLSS